MTHHLKDLMAAKALSEADGKPARMAISELFYDPETRRIRYAAVDARGGWFQSTEVLVSIDRFATPGQDAWPVSISRSEIEEAPRWTPEDEERHDGGVLASMPPLVVGPFGSTYAPMMMAAAVQDQAQERSDAPDEDAREDEPRETDPRAERRLRRMERASAWLGREAFGDDGFLGKVDDMVVSDAMVLLDAVLEDGHRLPLARLRALPPQGHAVFDILKANLA